MSWNRNRRWKDFQALVNAEDYFAFFELPYDPRVVNVNRLHILRKFAQYLGPLECFQGSEEERLEQARQALEKAYQTFLTSTPQQEKLFRVFQDYGCPDPVGGCAGCSSSGERGECSPGIPA
ncbi:nitrogenase-stabilizing/protective protein NifW [Synechococcus sp. R5-13]|jgi:nitrogenase-stabilizing/protective protein|uniref:nitrogenase-stabilizing/protective protein NifW n=1 Tax=Synechococcus sp. R5-13 TaxID=2291953 RepID=UPI0039C02E27